KLTKASKDFQRIRQQRRATAEQVAGALPQRTVLVDFLHYVHYEPDPKRKGAWQGEDRLLAFVLVKGQPPVCVSLGPSAPLDRLITAWRAPLTAERPTPPSEAVARELRRQLWLPLEKHLAGASTILIAPDGALCGLPFAALPGSKAGSFLLEERTIGYV